MELTDPTIRIALAFILNAVLAAGTYAGKVVSRSGAIGGFAVGLIIYYFTDWRGYLVLVTFFVLGTLVTKVKYKEKVDKGIAQEDEGRRGSKHAIANASTAILMGILSFFFEEYRYVFLAGFTGAFATALSDTASSEIGQAYGKTTILLTSFKRVPPGTEGAVSAEGTFAGIFASIILAIVALLAGVVLGWQGIVAIVLAAFIGNTLESLIGSTIEQLKFINNEVTNFINTLIGATAAMLIYSILT